MIIFQTSTSFSEENVFKHSTSSATKNAEELCISYVVMSVEHPEILCDCKTREYATKTTTNATTKYNNNSKQY